MKPDYLSYRRATSVSLIGLVLQLVMGSILLIYGYQVGDHAAVTASSVALVGVLVWLVLAVVFDQHRRERVEAIEAEALSDEPTASVFDRSGDDLRVAARRLAGMHKIFLPIVSLLVGGALIGLGIWRLSGADELRTEPVAETMPHYAAPLALSLGLGLGFIGFVFARYVSGMSKQEAWTNLRGGAGYAVATSLAGIAMGVGAIAEIAGQDVVLRYLPTILAVAEIVLGVEVFLNFLLNLYRPRRPGETPRPAFDSGVLAFVAAPDRIAESIGEALNYQFGFDVAGTWAYKLLSRVLGLLLVFAVIVIWLLTSLVVLEPHQRGLLVRWGEPVREVGPGLHFKYPWPIDRVDIPSYIERDASGDIIRRERTAEGVRVRDAGTDRPRESSEPILWTTDHADNESFLVCQAGTGAGSGDLALVAVEVPVHYSIENVELYEQLGPPEIRDQLLEAVARREVMRYVGSRAVDEILGRSRTELSQTLFERIERAFAQLNPDDEGNPRGAGVKIHFVGAEGVHPPSATAPNYERVVSAEQQRIARMENARANAIRTLTGVAGSVEQAEGIAEAIRELESLKRTGAGAPAIAERVARVEELLTEAGGLAAATIRAAGAERWRTHLDAKRRATLHDAQLASYQAQPELFRADAYLNALLRIMEGARVFITDLDAEQLRVIYELHTRDTDIDVFNSVEEEF